MLLRLLLKLTNDVLFPVGQYKSDVVYEGSMDRLSEHEITLGRKLCEFLDSRMMYSLRRLPSSELEHIYVGPTGGGRDKSIMLCGS